MKPNRYLIRVVVNEVSEHHRDMVGKQVGNYLLAMMQGGEPPTLEEIEWAIRAGAEPKTQQAVIRASQN